MQKVTSIEFFRFLFMLQVCLWHFGHLNGLMTNGYIAVEFYFILSGYLLYISQKKKISALDYSINKMKRILPRITFAYLLGGVIYIDTIVDNPLKVFNDIFFISSSGLTSFRGVLNPLWYISAYIIGSSLIFSLLNFNKRLTINNILPISTLLVYTFILNHNNFSLESRETYFCLHIPFWRGVAGMSLGCFLCKIQEIKKNSIDEKYNLVLNILSIISLIVSLLYIFIHANEDAYMLFIYCCIILSAFSPTSVFNRLFNQKIWLKLGGCSLDMLIIHPFIIRIVRYISNNIIQLNEWTLVYVYIILVVVSSLLFSRMYQTFMRKQKVFQ